jgi:hypothetical protein
MQRYHTVRISFRKYESTAAVFHHAPIMCHMYYNCLVPKKYQNPIGNMAQPCSLFSTRFLPDSGSVESKC